MDKSHIPPELMTEYLQTLPTKLKTIKERIDCIRQEPTDENLEAFRFAVHKLAGNTGTYGYLEASRLCKEMLDKLREKTTDLDLDSFYQKLTKALG